ncbi:cysteine-rich CWC family protein [Piscinibacter koreensis]|uniref:Cysteine-rich CWC family protein n=1 Tax=Piscinibacter koreensis TaxID=2742824 RepID=A0A7Y6NLF5_9BURK|nr:cysteine-rich CWC family protein [Schlegelella koreensis]NUZ05363.1 cysteine-rich CWC family protein [Schlegelella koreensis]
MRTAAAPPTDTSSCPLCGELNQCALAGGTDPANRCWCADASFSAELLASVPPTAAGRACICAACAARGVARRSGGGAEAEVEVPHARSER